MSDGGDDPNIGNGRYYTVGYGRPPIHSRFQKGRSGNPRGRPVGAKTPGAKTLAALLHKALDRRITVAGDGGPRRLTKREAIVTHLVDRSVQADLRATRLLLDIMRNFEGMAADRDAESTPERDARAALSRHLDRLAAAMAEPPREPDPAAAPNPATIEAAQGELPGSSGG